MTLQNELYIIGTSYLSITGRFLNKYEKDQAQLRAFLGWHLVRSLIPLSSFALTKKLMVETSEPQLAVSFLEACIGRVSDIAAFALAHFFFNKFLSASSLKTAEALVNEIRETSLMAFRNLSWMEEGTRREAVHKLSSLHKIVAFPKELSSPEAIDAHYAYLPKFRSVHSYSVVSVHPLS